MTSISNHYDRCRTSFEQLIEALRSPLSDYGDHIPLRGVINEFGRFKVWAGSLGAHHQPHKRISLDYRLKDSEFYKNRVVELLVDLVGTIQKAVQLLNNERRPCGGLDEDVEQMSDPESEDDASTIRSAGTGEFEKKRVEKIKGSDSGPSAFESLRALVDAQGSLHDRDNPVERHHSDGSNPGEPATERIPEMMQVYQSIQNVVKHLYTISTIIRRPIPTDLLSRSSKVPVSHFEPFDERHVDDCFPDASPVLKKRLAKAITRRRQLLVYNEQHYRKIAEFPEQPRGELQETISNLQAGKQTIPSAQIMKPDLLVVPSEPTPSTFVKSMLGPSTEATKPNLPEATPAVDVQSESGTLSSFAFSENGRQKIRIPPRPRDSDGEDMDQFLCPYCFHLIEISSSRAWTKHIFRDLQAYVCTFDDCKEPDCMFETRNEWFSHELECHRREWHCNVAGHPVYQREKDFKDHMLRDHASKITEAQLPLLASMCERSSLSGALVCPICTENDHDIHNGFMRSRWRSTVRSGDEFAHSLVPNHEIQKTSNGEFNDGLDKEDLQKIVGWTMSLPEEYEPQTPSEEQIRPATPPSPTQSPPQISPFNIESARLKPHLAQHLERLALFSILPSKSTPDDDKSFNTVAALERSQSSARSSVRDNDGDDPFEDRSRIILQPRVDLVPFLDRLSSWIHDCEDNHPECKISDPTFSPTRLIDVGTRASPELRLCISPPVGVRYAFLSCFPEPGGLIMQSINTWTRGISYEDLPSTLQDAITLTRYVGLRYLWVERLCTVQGDHKNIVEATMRIPETVQNAHITIAASYGAHSDIGLFRKRYPTRTHTAETGRGSLDPRVWGFQEQYFSPRYLSFEASETTWRCNTTRHCECRKPVAYRKRPPSYQEWHYVIIPEYSTWWATYRQDRGEALVGIASHFETHLQDKLMAGLWKGDLVHGLHWLVTFPRLKTLLYPTWSWLSVKTPVIYETQIGAPLLDIVRTPRMDLGMNRSLENAITLRGRLMGGIMDRQPKDAFSLRGRLMGGITNSQCSTKPMQLNIIHARQRNSRLSSAADFLIKRLDFQSAGEEHEAIEFRLRTCLDINGPPARLPIPRSRRIKWWSLALKDLEPGVSTPPAHAFGKVQVFFDYVEDFDFHETKFDYPSFHCLWLSVGSEISSTSHSMHALMLKKREDGNYKRIGLLKVIDDPHSISAFVEGLEEWGKQEVTIY